MPSFFKRSAISLIILGMAVSVYAGVPSNTTSWPQLSGAFLGVEGLDLRPMNGDLDYVTVFPPTGSSGGTFSTNAISTSYDWSWRVYGGIKFTDNDDLTLSWMQLNTSNNDSVAPRGTASNGAGDSNPRWLFPAPWASVNGHVTFDLNDAYAVWGHTINFDNPWSVRFAGGLEYAKLNSHLSTIADATIFSGGVEAIGFESKNQTKGIGPRAEFDMTYHLPYGLALVGNVNGALLASTRDISLVPATLNTSEIFSSSEFSDRHVVVPKFGARLGASYTYVWGQAGGEGAPCRATTLIVDAGWQVESYIHAIERPEDVLNGFGNGFAPTQFGSGIFASTKTSNFSDQGLFLGVKVGTDWL